MSETGRPIFSISAAARMLGLPMATIRTWEDRYGLVVPHRNASGHQAINYLASHTTCRSRHENRSHGSAYHDTSLIATAHDAVNYKELLEWAPCIVDTRNALAGMNTSAAQVLKA